MLNKLTGFVFVGWLLCGCRSAPAPAPQPKEASDRAPENYGGPAVEASFLNPRDLRVTVTAPSGGHRFVLRETGRRGGVTFVKLTLEAPGQGAAAPTVIEKKTVRVPLLAEKGTVHVLVQQIERGAQYLTPPEFTLARIIDR